TFCFSKNFNIIRAWHISCFSEARTLVGRTPNAQVSGGPSLDGAWQTAQDRLSIAALSERRFVRKSKHEERKYHESQAGIPLVGRLQADAKPQK
ncbi:MAG: hypothetical protein ACO3UV_05235, partial [Pseudomonadales bacterium]